MSLSVNVETREIIHNDLIRYSCSKVDYSLEVFVWLKEGLYHFFEKRDSSDIVPSYDESYEFLGSVVIPADPELLLSKKKSDVLKILYEKVEGIYTVLSSEYTSLEKDSWAQQEAEARAIKAVKTPVIDSLCAVRGCSRDELAEKIIANSDAAKTAGIHVLSWQQGIEKKIKSMGLDDYDSLVGEILNG